MELTLPEKILAVCKKRGWSLNWEGRAAHLHLEASELIEAIRDKHGDPAKEAADVLFVLMSTTEANGISWQTVIERLNEKIICLNTKPRYTGEQYVETEKGTKI